MFAHACSVHVIDDGVARLPSRKAFQAELQLGTFKLPQECSLVPSLRSLALEGSLPSLELLWCLTTTFETRGLNRGFDIMVGRLLTHRNMLVP
jgi:hypothetical protein